MDNWVRAATEYVAGLESELKLDHKAFYDGTGRKRVREALDFVNELRQRIDKMHRG